jgi:tetratricopeptide (TPR) repeat protein
MTRLRAATVFTGLLAVLTVAITAYWFLVLAPPPVPGEPPSQTEDERQVPRAGPAGPPPSAAGRFAELKARTERLDRLEWDPTLFGQYEAIIRDARSLQEALRGTKEALAAQELVIHAYEKQAKFPERFDAFLRYAEMGERVYNRDMASKILLLEGNRNFKNKEFLTAHRFYEEVLSRYPEGRVAAVARFQVGRCFEEMGEWQVALRKYEALITAPAEAGGMKLEAWKRAYEVRARRGKTARALETLQAIREHYPGREEARWAQLERGAYLWRLRKTAQALQALQEVKKRHPGTPEARQAADHIRRIEDSLTDVDRIPVDR